VFVGRQKALKTPKWYLNSSFWFAAMLLIVAIVGLPFLGGEEAIRDPGQKREGGLAWMYFAAAALMALNGWLSHQHAVRSFEEASNQSKGF
jgi:NADH:ubiquinone oxidoreductase subunit H